jgi:hypothetical protein
MAAAAGGIKKWLGGIKSIKALLSAKIVRSASGLLQ